MTFTSQHLLLLLVHVFKTEPIRRLACQELKPAFFTDTAVGGCFAHSALFHIMQTHFDTSKAGVDLATLTVEFDETIKKFFEPGSEGSVSAKAEFVKFTKLINLADDRSTDLCRRLIARLVHLCVTTKAYSEVIQEADLSSGDKFADLAERIRSLSAAASRVGGGQSTDNALTADVADVGDRMPTHIPFLDSRLGQGRGPMSGCALAIIAPQGAGKTTLGIQLAVAQALAGMYALLVLAEEGLTKSLRRNLIAAATGLSTPLLEQFNDNIDEAVKASGAVAEVVQARVANVNKYLHVLDLTKTDGGLEDIEAELDAMCMAGKRPTYVYVDWAGMLADRMLSKGYRRRKFDKRYDALKTISYGCSAMAQRNNCMVALAQQMAPEVVEKGFASINDQYSAADFRGFSEPMKYVFVLNARDPRTGVSVFHIPKARNDTPGQRIIVRLRGELAMFEDVSDKFELKNKRIVNKGLAERPAVPRE